MIKYALLLVFALCAWIAVLALLTARPAASLAEASGLYAEQGSALAYRWTSNRVWVPLRAHSGPTIVTLALGSARWPGRAAPQVLLASDQRPLATFAAPDAIRRYRALLAPSSSGLEIRSTVDQPPQSDPRWLGVPLFSLTAVPSGLPLQAAVQALASALALVLLGLGAAWAIRHGHGVVAGLTALALLLRVIDLGVAPPGFRTDEVVSLVDAWHLARTGHDHLGHLLPLGAQEALGDWIAPLLTYLELPAVALFGPERLVGRLVTALVGALAAPCGYMLARLLRLPTAAAICVGVVVAVSPWQIFLSRIALPPALVPTSWMLCLWAGLLLIRAGGQRDALRLGLVAGVALYAYPTMKLAVPLLVGLASALALGRHGWSSARRWLTGGLLLGLLWLPFAYVTFFNPASSTRMNQAALRADSWVDWLAAWWAGYSVYFRPGFYFVSGDGDSIRGLVGRGVEPLVEAPLLAIGLAALLWRLGIRGKVKGKRQEAKIFAVPPFTFYLLPFTFNIQWWFVAGALLIAPLPASLTLPSPHAYRAATIAPLYALLVGLGAALVWSALWRIARVRVRHAAQFAGAAVLLAALAWQVGGWFRAYTRDYPPQQARANQDGLIEAMRRTIDHAPDFDEIWISYDEIVEPYIYLLAAQPMPPAQAQVQIVVTRRPGHFNAITNIGRYHFVDMASVPRRLAVLEALPDQFGRPAFVIQQWQHEGKRVLIVRRMD